MLPLLRDGWVFVLQEIGEIPSLSEHRDEFLGCGALLGCLISTHEAVCDSMGV